MALTVNDAFLRIQAAGQVNRGQLQAAAAKVCRILTDGDGMLVDDAVNTVIGVLQLRKMAQRTDLIANGQSAAGLNAREDPFLFFNLLFHLASISFDFYSTALMAFRRSSYSSNAGSSGWAF